MADTTEYLGRLVQPEPHFCLTLLPREPHHDALAGDVRRCTCGEIWAFGFWGKTYLSWRRLSWWRAWQARRLLRKQARLVTPSRTDRRPPDSSSVTKGGKGTDDPVSTGG